jgi:hypothetical protein
VNITQLSPSKVDQLRKYYNDVNLAGGVWRTAPTLPTAWDGVPTNVEAGVNVAVMIGRSPTGGSVLSRAADLPVYTRTQALTGTAILLALCLIVVAVIALGWWQRR